jgi:GLPGLI family protein
MMFGKLIPVLMLVFFSQLAISQIQSGRIVFERKTNLMKRFKDSRPGSWLNEKNKIKVDNFELFFNDTLSVFRPLEVEGKDEMSWATNKNTVQQNLISQERISVYAIWGENMYVQDSLKKRTWKITESTRKIGKYECRKAFFQVNDTIRIYAWYTDEIIPSVGPETFNGLPGAILGLATEDGGVIYFAKSVEVLQPDFSKLLVKVGKNKVHTDLEAYAILEKQFGNKPGVASMIADIFMW